MVILENDLIWWCVKRLSLCLLASEFNPHWQSLKTIDGSHWKQLLPLRLCLFAYQTHGESYNSHQ